MTVRLESVTFTSGDGTTAIPSYLATPDGSGPHAAVLILRGVAGPDDGYTEIARRLAEWGYVALLHGWKVRGADPTDAPVYDDLDDDLEDDDDDEDVLDDEEDDKEDDDEAEDDDEDEE